MDTAVRYYQHGSESVAFMAMELSISRSRHGLTVGLARTFGSGRIRWGFGGVERGSGVAE